MVAEQVRRAVLFSVFVVALPLVFIETFAGTGQAGPRSQLVSSWVDEDGTAHLNFVVGGVDAASVVTADLVLHRRQDSPSTALRVSAGSWSTTAGGPGAVDVDVSSVVRGNGTVQFDVSAVTPASAPAIVVSPGAGADAPSLVVKATDARSRSAAARSAAADSVDAATHSSADARDVLDPGSSSTPPFTSQADTSWQSLWVALAPPPPGSTSTAWVPVTSTASGCEITPLLVPSCGAWWGIGAVPAAGQSPVAANAEFDALQGRSSGLLHYYHVGSATFPTPAEISSAHAAGKSAVLMENWKPELGRSWAQVAAGDPAVDAEIDHEAEYLKGNYSDTFFLSIHHEPEDEVDPAPGSGFTAADYAAMYRHVVTRLRADGVTNAVFVVDYMGSPKWGEHSWFNDLYPGDDVVDWIAEDPYSFGSGGQWRTDFAGMVNRRDGSPWPGFYTWATTTHPGKPIMLGEWGVTEDLANPAAKVSFFSTMLTELRQFPALKALVYWNSPGTAGKATAIDSDPEALAAFRLVAASAAFQESGG